MPPLPIPFRSSFFAFPLHDLVHGPATAAGVVAVAVAVFIRCVVSFEYVQRAFAHASRQGDLFLIFSLLTSQLGGHRHAENFLVRLELRVVRLTAPRRRDLHNLPPRGINLVPLSSILCVPCRELRIEHFGLRSAGDPPAQGNHAFFLRP